MTPPPVPELRPGLCSVTLRKHSAPEIIRLAGEAGLAGIEWGGDVHIPPGETAIARNIGAQTRAAGLEIVSYGSYYRLGHSETNGMPFAGVLETAAALGAPVIRVWAGTKSPDKATQPEQAAVSADATRIASLAQTAGVRVALEFHSGTLTETAQSTQSLLDEANHPNLFTLWQPIYWGEGATTEANEAILRTLLPRTAHLHVFHWEQKIPGATERFPLARGESAWKRYLSLLSATPAATDVPRWLCLEFVAEDSPANLSADAATLKRWLSVAG